MHAVHIGVLPDHLDQVRHEFPHLTVKRECWGIPLGEPDDAQPAALVTLQSPKPNVTVARLLKSKIRVLLVPLPDDGATLIVVSDWSDFSREQFRVPVKRHLPVTS